jgi:hypothetical protein
LADDGGVGLNTSSDQSRPFPWRFPTQRIFLAGLLLLCTSGAARAETYYIAGFGLHLYDSLSNSVIENNLVYGQSKLPAVIVSCPAEGGHNRIVNNTFVGNGAAIVVRKVEALPPD